MEKVGCIFIKDARDAESLNVLLRKGRISPKDTAIVAWDRPLAKTLEKHGMKTLVLEDFTKHIGFDDIRGRALELVKTFPHKKLIGKKSLVELLEYNGQSLWWFVRQGFFIHCAVVLKESYSVETAIRRLKAQNIGVLSRDAVYNSMMEEIGKRLNVAVKFHDSCAKPGNDLTARAAFSEFPVRIFRALQGILRAPFTKPGKAEKNVLVFTQAHMWTALAQGIEGDANCHTIIEALKKSGRYSLTLLDVAVNRQAALKGIKKKKSPYIPYEYFTFKSFFDIGMNLRLLSLKKRLKAVFASIDGKPKVREAMECGGVDAYSILRPVISHYFHGRFDSFASAARNIEIGMKLIKGRKIDYVICVDENGSSRFLVFAARQAGANSVAVQHGIIHPYHISYNYGTDDFGLHENGLGCILADKTAVFGDYFRELLLKYGNYPADGIFVTGQPKTDIIYERKKNYSKEGLCRKLAISPEKKIVMFASGPLKDSMEMKTALSALAESLRQARNAHLVIKLHPNDDEQYYRDIMKELDFSCTIIRDIDLYELLYASDIVIAINSTVLLDALLMKKKVLQLNLLERYELIGGAGKEMLPRITGKVQLSNEIKKMLSGKRPEQQMPSGRKGFSHYYMDVDGKATERLVKLLDNGMIRHG